MESVDSKKEPTPYATRFSQLIPPMDGKSQLPTFLQAHSYILTCLCCLINLFVCAVIKHYN